MSKEGCSFHYYLKVFEGFLFERIFPLLSTILTSKTETVSPSLRISVSISARLGEDWASCARNTVNSLYSGQCSSVVWSFVARVRNSGSFFFSQMSVIYFCPVSARRELTVINSVINSGKPFPRLFFTRVCFKFFSFVASQISKIKQKRKKNEFYPHLPTPPSATSEFFVPSLSYLCCPDNSVILVPVVKEFFMLS